jgi:DNA polymerase-3 subunit delta'
MIIDPWNLDVWQRLVARYRQDTMPHALLFSGLPGLGKSRLAEQLAAAVLCHSPEAGGLACGKCKACQLIQAGSHSDLHRINPEEDSKYIKIDQIRDFCDVMSRTSQLGGYRIGIVNPADAMNVNAANSLLKTLEEPGARSVMILVTSHLSKLPATIRSRCQLINFNKPKQELAESWLREQGVVEDVGLLLGLAQGAPRQALAFSEGKSLAARSEFLKDLEDLRKGVQDPLTTADKWGKAETERCLNWMYSWLADLICLKSTSEAAGIINRDRLSELQGQSKKIDLLNLYQLLDGVQAGLRQLQTQVNQQMLMEDILIRWQEVR